jgi:hypothetical protein
MNIYQTTRHMSEDSIQRNIYQFICTWQKKSGLIYSGRTR